MQFYRNETVTERERPARRRTPSLFLKQNIDLNPCALSEFPTPNGNPESLPRYVEKVSSKKAVVDPNDRDFWMPDRYCRVCYNCGVNFSVFRRRHHCRWCGQVFCSSCSSLFLHGGTFGVSGPMRVCEFCFVLIEEEARKIDTSRHRGSRSFSDSTSDSVEGATKGKKKRSRKTISDFSVRKYNSSPQMRFLRERKTVTGPQRTLSTDAELEDIDEDLANKVFCSVVEEDPREAEAEEEIAAIEKAPTPTTQEEPIPLTRSARSLSESGVGMLTAADEAPSTPPRAVTPPPTLEISAEREVIEREMRSIEPGSRGDAGFDPNAHRKSLGDNGDWEVAITRLPALWPNARLTERAEQPTSWAATSPQSEGAMKRERDADVVHHRRVESSGAAHLRRMVRTAVCGHHQLRKRAEEWTDTILVLARQSAMSVTPLTGAGDSMDIREYVHIQTIPGGAQEASHFVDGVVTKHNVAQRAMRLNISNPRVMLMASGLEFERVGGRLSSFNTLLEQEGRFLGLLVAKICTFRPDVLLVHRTVCHRALEALKTANITVVTNVEFSVLRRISRLTGASIIRSVQNMDKTQSHRVLGRCRQFIAKTFFVPPSELSMPKPRTSFQPEQAAADGICPSPSGHHNEGDVGNSSMVAACGCVPVVYLYFLGCPTDRGCTLCLRGASRDRLKYLKSILRFAVYLGYTLRLETSLLLDIGFTMSPIAASMNDDDEIDPALAARLQKLLPDVPGEYEKALSMELPTSPHIGSSVRCVDSEAGEGDPVNMNELVLSSSWMVKDRQCTYGEMKSITFFSESDVGLAQFLDSHVFAGEHQCVNDKCSEPYITHTLSYVHHSGRVNIDMRSLPKPVVQPTKTALLDTASPTTNLLVCSVCRSCRVLESRWLPLSPDAGSWSFGKFLEMLFFNRTVSSRGRTCSHCPSTHGSIFFAAGSVIARIRFLELPPLPVCRIVSLPPNTQWLQGVLIQDVMLLMQVLESVVSDFAGKVAQFSTRSQQYPRAAKELADLAVGIDAVSAEFQCMFQNTLGSGHDVLMGLKRERQKQGKAARKLGVSQSLVGMVEDAVRLSQACFDKMSSDDLMDAIFMISALKRRLCALCFDWNGTLVEVEKILKGEAAEPEVDHPTLSQADSEAKHLSRTVSVSEPLMMESIPVGQELAEDSPHPLFEPCSPPKPSAKSSRLREWMPAEEEEVEEPPGTPKQQETFEGDGFGEDEEGPALFRDRSAPPTPRRTTPRLPEVKEEEEGEGEEAPVPEVSVSEKLAAMRDKLIVRPEKWVGKPMPVAIPNELVSGLPGLPPGYMGVVVPVDYTKPGTVIAYSLASEWVNAEVRFQLAEHIKKRPGPWTAEAQLLSPLPSHVRHRFGSQNVRFTVRTYFATQFHALRESYTGKNTQFVLSMAHAQGWAATGGKSGASFFQTDDGRFVGKMITQTEAKMFLHMAPAYFEYMAKAVFHGRYSCLAKLLGLYKLSIQTPGHRSNVYYMAMENLFYQRNIPPALTFDLKGKTRRQKQAEAQKVRLDSDLMEFTHGYPLLLTEPSKALLNMAVLNDTLFLSLVKCVDYSLLLGVDIENGELVVGVIDYIRRFDWMKKFEYVGKRMTQDDPTILDPDSYKLRFRRSMDRYFQPSPNRFSPQQTLQPADNDGDLGISVPATVISELEKEDGVARAKRSGKTKKDKQRGEEEGRTSRRASFIENFKF